MLQGILYRGKITNLHPHQWPSWILSNPALWSRGAGLRFLRAESWTNPQRLGVSKVLTVWGSGKGPVWKGTSTNGEISMSKAYRFLNDYLLGRMNSASKTGTRLFFFSEGHRTCPSALRCPCKIKLQQGPGWVGVHSSSCCLHVSFFQKWLSLSLSLPLSPEAPACVTIVPPIN